MEIFLLWLWLSLPAIFWAGLLALKVTTILRAKVNNYLDAEIKAINQENK